MMKVSFRDSTRSFVIKHYKEKERIVVKLKFLLSDSRCVGSESFSSVWGCWLYMVSNFHRTLESTSEYKEVVWW